jgi:hypothetical protein
MKSEVLTISITEDTKLGYAFKIGGTGTKVTSSSCFPNAEMALEGALMFVQRENQQPKTFKKETDHV